MKILFKTVAVLSLMANLHAAEEGWLTDFEAAKTKAAKEGKDLFINFIGSDWCGYCKVLDKQIFSKDDFMQKAGDRFVMVKLDFPKKPENKAKLSDELTQQNKQLKREYQVRGFPTIYLTDAEGRPYARTGFLRVTPEQYLGNLIKLQSDKVKRDESFDAANKAEGLPKGELLAQGLMAVHLRAPGLRKFYAEEIRQLETLDPEDQTGYMGRLKTEERINQLNDTVNGLIKKKDVEGAFALLDDAIANGGYEPHIIRQLYTSKAKIHYSMKQYDEAFKEVDEAMMVEPENEKAKASLIAYRKKMEDSITKMEAAAAKKLEAAKKAEEAKKANEAAKPKAEEAPKEKEEPIRARDK